jgi:hypothetical protein
VAVCVHSKTESIEYKQLTGVRFGEFLVIRTWHGVIPSYRTYRFSNVRRLNPRGGLITRPTLVPHSGELKLFFGTPDRKSDYRSFRTRKRRANKSSNSTASKRFLFDDPRTSTLLQAGERLSSVRRNRTGILNSSFLTDFSGI